MVRLAAALLSAAVASSSPALAFPYAHSSIGRAGYYHQGGATPIFDCTAFNVAGCDSSAFSVLWNARIATASPYEVDLTPAGTSHQAGSMWYVSQQSINAWTADVTFAMAAGGYGMVFCIQNYADNTTWHDDANGLGYAVYPSLGQPVNPNSACIKFDNTNINGYAYIGAVPSTTGVYMNGAPDMNTVAFSPSEDMNPYSIQGASTDLMDAHFVYDGTNLTMVLKDTVTGAQMRKVWPLALINLVGSSNAWIGMTAGTTNTTPTTGALQSVYSMAFWEGYNTRLATPTISPAAGQYSTSQSVTIGCPSGATCYYTTNGKLPTTSDTQYTGAITVSSNEVVQAVATESGFTDSNVATANYQIQASGPTINFPSGFSAAASLITVNGAAQISASSIQLADTAHTNEIGTAWYVVPVNISSFSTTFTLQFPASTSSGNGVTFCIQNYLPAADQINNSTSGPFVLTGGPNALGANVNGADGAGLGYADILSSVAIKFDLYGSGGNASLVGLYQDGAAPGGSNAGDTDVSSQINFHSSTPIVVNLSYSSGTLSLYLTQGANRYPASGAINYTVNVPSVVGGSTAYVGFTAGNGGGATGLLDISNWTGF